MADRRRPSNVDPLGDVVPTLLAERGWTQRQLAEAIGVDPAHLSRVIRRLAGRRPSADLVERAASVLGLPRDYFPEYREQRVIDAVRRDPVLRDRLYRGLPDA